MTGLTPDDLAAIRERVESDSHIIVLTDAETALCESDREDLLIEVDRLRAGIEGIKAKALDHRKIITEGPLVGRILVSHWCDKALDPTEGETDER